MLVTEIYNGQGLGNQLWSYIFTKCLARDYNYDFGVQSPYKFKGHNLFLNITEQMGDVEVKGGSGPEGGPPTKLPEGIDHYYKERQINHPIYGCNISPIDVNLFRLPPNTKIDGYFQAESYIEHRKDKIKDWLKINPEYYEEKYSNKDTCVINFRGGPEYIPQKDLFLPKEYWNRSIEKMREINPDMKFIVITDDVKTSKEWFPDFEVRHKTLEWDYSVIHNAYYSIVSNSSFAWFAVWTSSKNILNIAPKFWARHNISDGFWSNGESLTKDWLYLDRSGNFSDYGKCKVEHFQYKLKFLKEYNIQL
jgi:hypothetical protein